MAMSVHVQRAITLSFAGRCRGARTCGANQDHSKSNSLCGRNAHLKIRKSPHVTDTAH